MASGAADIQQLQRAGEEVRGTHFFGEQPESTNDAVGKKVSDQRRHQTAAGERGFMSVLYSNNQPDMDIISYDTGVRQII